MADLTALDCLGTPVALATLVASGSEGLLGGTLENLGLLGRLENLCCHLRCRQWRFGLLRARLGSPGLRSNFSDRPDLRVRLGEALELPAVPFRLRQNLGCVHEHLKTMAH